MYKNCVVFFATIFVALTVSSQDYYYPQVFFNAKQADSMLARGTSKIEGVAYTKPKTGWGFKAPLAKKQYAPAGTIVTLFPCTDYFYTWHSLYKKYANKNTSILMSQEAFSYHLQAKTDNYGRFSFDSLKTGKYYMEVVIPYTVRMSYQEQTGVSNTYYRGGYVVSSPIYSTFFYNAWDSNRETLFVEVTKDGQLVEVKLK